MTALIWAVQNKPHAPSGGAILAIVIAIVLVALLLTRK